MRLLEWNQTDEADPPPGIGLDAYVARIEDFCSRRPDLAGVRAYNHQMVDALDQVRGLAGRRLLDVGASYAGFALERALELGVLEYVGVSLQVAGRHDVCHGQGRGQLVRMDAERLDLPEQSFDLALSLSCFEHFHDGPRVLDEIHRVLRPGGAALVSFEPLWTCAYGHHLHHLPAAAASIPAWGHLLWTADEMRRELRDRWRADAECSLDDAVDWTYRQPFINRLPIDVVRRQFEASRFEIEWLVPLRDPEAAAHEARAHELAQRLPWSAEELLTIGFSILLRRPSSGARPAREAAPAPREARRARCIDAGSGLDWMRAAPMTRRAMSRPAADDSEVLAAAPPPQTEAVPAVSLVETPQWLRPVQLGPATLLEWSRRPDTLAAVEATLALLAPDDYVDFMRRYYRLGRERFGAEWAYADQLTVLQAAARLLRPERYLEIGVFRGRSLSIVAAAAPACELFGFDLWIPGYAGLDNAGPELVREQLRRVGHAGGCRLESGRSGETLPRFLRDSPDLYFDLVTVDGDHGEEGARADLEAVLPRVRVGGVLVFDDIRHPRHPWLERVWDEVVGALPSFSSAKYVEVGHGIAFGVRVERDDELTARLSGDATRRLETVSRQLVELRAKREELLAVIQQQRQDLGRVAELDRMWREVESASNRGRRQAVVERHFHELARIPALEAEISQLEAQREVLEADRAKRLEVIESQGVLLGQARAEANLARAQVDQLERQVELLEADRAKRLEVIESQGVSLGQALAEANLARAQVNQLERQMELLEADRAKRLEIIESQGVSLGQALAEANFKRVEVEQLKRQMDALEADRAARLAIIERQGGELGRAQAEANVARAEVEQLKRQVDALEADRAARLAVIERQGEALGRAQAEANVARVELEQVKRQIDALEADRAARLAVIQRQGDELGRAQADANVARAELQQWRAQAEASAAASARAESEVETLRRQAEASECEIRRLRAQIQAVGGAVESARTELASARLPLLTPRKLTRVRGHMAEAARNLAAPSTDGDSPADSPSGNSGD